MPRRAGKRRVRPGRWILAAVAALTALLVAHMLLLARSDPVVRRTYYHAPGWPAGMPPVRAVLVTDTHASWPDTPPARLARLIATVNGLEPDVVLLGGDYVGNRKYLARAEPLDVAVAPFGSIRARLGTFAVIGNHDEWLGAARVTAALRAQGVTVLDRAAVRAGPLAIGGIEFAHGRWADIQATVQALRAAGGVPIFLAHTPDVFHAIPSDVGLTLAGHTHCGQLALPGWGPLFTASRYGLRYACGRVDERGRTLITSGGVGTSIVPFRLGVPPDIWVIDIGK